MTAPPAVSTVTTPGGTTLGGALVTCPAFTRSISMLGVSDAVKGNWRTSRAPGRATRRMMVEVRTAGTSVVLRRLATVIGLAGAAPATADGVNRTRLDTGLVSDSTRCGRLATVTRWRSNMRSEAAV